MPFDAFGSTSNASDSRIGASDQAQVTRKGNTAKDNARIASGKGAKNLSAGAVDIAGANYTGQNRYDFTGSKGNITIQEVAPTGSLQTSPNTQPQVIPITVPGAPKVATTEDTPGVTGLIGSLDWKKWALIAAVALGGLYLLKRK